MYVHIYIYIYIYTSDCYSVALPRSRDGYVRYTMFVFERVNVYISDECLSSK